MTSGRSPGPAPGRDHTRFNSTPRALCNWQTLPHVNERRNSPNVDGALPRNGSPLRVAPDRSRSA